MPEIGYVFPRQDTPSLHVRGAENLPEAKYAARSCDWRFRLLAFILEAKEREPSHVRVGGRAGSGCTTTLVHSLKSRGNDNKKIQTNIRKETYQNKKNQRLTFSGTSTLQWHIVPPYRARAKRVPSSNHDQQRQWRLLCCATVLRPTKRPLTLPDSVSYGLPARSGEATRRGQHPPPYVAGHSTQPDLQVSLLSSIGVGSSPFAARAHVVKRSSGPGASGPPSTTPASFCGWGAFPREGAGEKGGGGGGGGRKEGGGKRRGGESREGWREGGT